MNEYVCLLDDEFIAAKSIALATCSAEIALYFFNGPTNNQFKKRIKYIADFSANRISFLFPNKSDGCRIMKELKFIAEMLFSISPLHFK